MSRARRASVDISYEHVNITDDLAGCLKSFSYTDIASGGSDSISIAVQDRERKWMGGWSPKKGDHMSANAGFSDWTGDGDHWGMYCGEFEVDDVSMSGPPASCSIKAVSIPRSEAFNEEERTKNWEDVTVQEIASEIAGRAGINLFYQAEDIPVRAMEQDRQTDCKFLYAVCEKFGLAMKVFAGKIVIFDEAQYESAGAVDTLHYEDFSKWSYNSTLAGTYTGAKIAYTDPGTAEDHIVMVGGGSRIMEINEEADSAEDARRKAIAALNNTNKKDTTFSGTVMARRALVASCCVNIAGFGVPDGTYYLDEVVTRIGGNGASQQSLSMHRVGYRMDDAVVLIDAQPEEVSSGEGGSHTVVKGDTLWTIAEEYLGSPLRYAEIYNLNRDVIEEAAKGRGKRDSSNGHWLVPGTELQIPAGEGGAGGGE